MKLNLKTENVSGGVSGGQWNNAENSAQVWEWSAQCIYRKNNKIALSASNDKRLKTRNEIISYLYGKVDGRVSNAKLIKYKKKKKNLNTKINPDYFTEENRQQHNPRCPRTPDHRYRIILVEGSESRKKNALPINYFVY